MNTLIQSKKIQVILFLLTLLGAMFVFAPAFVHAQGSSGTSLLENIIYMDDAGPVVFGKMLQSWVSLFAAAIILLLTSTYMKGGYLARPLFLIGAGALVNALMGLVLPLSLFMHWMWLGELIFSSCVIVAIFWMEKLFRVSQS